MTKPSLIPASAPTSPLVHRNKQNHHPSTPQRALHHSASARHYASPFTPATSLSTPYTPLSLRSFSSNGSSIATPASAVVGRRRNLSLSLTSPEMHAHSQAQNRSLADIAQNWRTRANENGIKVSPGDQSKFQGEYMRFVYLLDPRLAHYMRPNIASADPLSLIVDDCSMSDLSMSSIDECASPPSCVYPFP